MSDTVGPHAASLAWNRCFIRRAHNLRAARNLATSSNRSVNAAKKNDTRGASSFTSSPAATARRTYSSPFANGLEDRKSTRLNSSHLVISYAVFCLKKKKKKSAGYHP